MDTKQKKRDGERKAGQRRDARKPAENSRDRAKAAEQQKKRRPAPQAENAAAPQKERRSVPQKRRAPQTEQQRPARQAPAQQQRAQRQPAPQQPAAQLPQEEVYRPTPSQERHSQEQRREAPQAAGTSRSKTGSRTRPARSAIAKRGARAAAKAKKPVRPPRKNAPAVIYTRPAPFNLNRLLIQLLTVTALVLAFTMALSIFFKVEVVTVSGADVYSEWTVRDASGIEEGDSLLTFSRARAGARIRAELPYVERVRFGIKLPNTVIIDIVELDVVYAIQASDGLWWFVTSEGRVVEQTDDGTARNYTKIEGVTLQSPVSGETATAWEEPQAPTTDPTVSTGSTDPSDTTPPTSPVPTTTNADRLAAALQIVRALEDNDVVGEVTKVDVSDLGAIMLDYGSRYDVKLGNTDNLDYKVASMCDAVRQMSEYQIGVLDVSFSIWQDTVIFTPTDD